MAYAPPDFLRLEDLLTDEERQIAAGVRRWVDDRVLPIMASAHREGRFPTQLIAEMGQLGLLGPTLRGYGCAGAGYTAYGLMMRELERGDTALRSFASVQGALVMWPIAEFGTEAQRLRWLPRLATGEAIGCFGLTEPDFGSNPGGMRTRAVPSDRGWILNGTKRWITNGTLADLAVVWARREDGRIGGFLVERGRRGFSARDIDGKFSVRASTTSELYFDDCFVEESDRLPGAEGLGAAFRCLTHARYGIAWGALGAAEACWEEAARYARERIQFSGRPIASHQLVQAKLADMLTEITKAGLLAWRLGRLMETGESRPAMISMAKMNNARMALACARAARDILGANGITDAYQTIRHLLNLETVNTYEGTEDIHRLVIGREITGIAAFE